MTFSYFSKNGDMTQDQKDQDTAKAIKQRKKKMKTVKRLNNGVIGKRQLQQKQGMFHSIQISHIKIYSFKSTSIYPLQINFFSAYGLSF